MVGIDATNGRFGNVKIEVCKKCHTSWLSYQVEYEAFSKSGRWYRGIIGAESIASMSPEEAPKYLEGLAWYFEGGSYFDSNGKLSKGHLFLDI